MEWVEVVVAEVIVVADSVVVVPLAVLVVEVVLHQVILVLVVVVAVVVHVHNLIDQRMEVHVITVRQDHLVHLDRIDVLL